MEKFIIDGRYSELLRANHLEPTQVLRQAQLPIDTFAHTHLKLTAQEYFALIKAIEKSSDDPLLATKLVATDHLETFSPPIFAAFCSKNGEQFILRLAHYKKLIGPVSYQLTRTATSLTVTLQALDSGLRLPAFFVEGEFAFLTKMLSKATGQRIYPLRITTSFRESKAELADYFGIPFRSAPGNTISFSLADLNRPFVSENNSILEYLEPELKKRLATLDVDSSYSNRVRNALVELLPRGEADIDKVARSLGLSKRSLQRKLKAENTNFQQQLNATREMLAKNYLLNSTMTVDDIAFLLGYQETNSFLRAFSTWTGMTTSQYRQQSTEVK